MFSLFYLYIYIYNVFILIIILKVKVLQVADGMANGMYLDYAVIKTVFKV